MTSRSCAHSAGLFGRLVATVFAPAFLAGAAFLTAAFLTTAAFFLFAPAFFASGALFAAAFLAGFTAFFELVFDAAATFFFGVVFLATAFERFAGCAVLVRAFTVRLAMFESFRNLDSVAISVVLSDAYRKSDGAAEHLLTSRNCGPPDPATRTPALVRMGRDCPNHSCDDKRSAQGMANVEDEQTPVKGAGSLDRAERELARVAAMRAIVTCEEGWAPLPIPDVDRALARLRIEGTRLDGRELQQAGVLLRSSRLTGDALRSARRPAVALSVLAPLRERLHANRKQEEEIERALDVDGSVRDDASHALRRVRRELRNAQGELVALLERIMHRLETHHQVPDASVTVRNGPDPSFEQCLRNRATTTMGACAVDSGGTGGLGGGGSGTKSGCRAKNAAI